MFVVMIYLYLYKIKKYPLILALSLLAFYLKCLLFKSNNLSLYVLLMGGLISLSYEDYLNYAVYSRHLRRLEVILFIYIAIFQPTIFLSTIIKFLACLGIVYLGSSFFYFIYKQKGMGEADYEIIALIYMCASYQQTLYILWLSCILGIIYLRIKNEKKLPFIPFLTFTSALILA